MKDEKQPATPVNLDEAARLVAVLQQDLSKVRGDSHDIQRLRDEVETLAAVLNAPVRRHHWVEEGLHSVRNVFEEAVDTAVAQGMRSSAYIAEIGRILGL